MRKIILASAIAAAALCGCSLEDAANIPGNGGDNSCRD